MTMSSDPALLERARQIRLLALDVDGILTDGRLYFDSEGREIKAFHVADVHQPWCLGTYGRHVVLWCHG